MSVCTCTPKQKESGRYGKRCTAHNGHSTSAYAERKRPHRAKTDATLPESSKLWRDTGEELRLVVVRAIHTLRQKEGDVATVEAIVVAFMFATAAHPKGSTVKIKVSYPFVKTKKT